MFSLFTRVGVDLSCKTSISSRRNDIEPDSTEGFGTIFQISAGFSNSSRNMATHQTLPAQTLEGKIAIVTGSARGLGAEMATELARRGAKVSLII